MDGIFIKVAAKLLQVAIVLFLIAVLPGIPPHVEFEAFSVTPSMPLEGALSLNTALDGAERLFDGEIHGPEGLAAYDDTLYMTLYSGFVARLNQHGDLEPVVKFGQDCDGFHEERKCGRPLGMTFDKNGQMYVADAFYGLYKVDPSNGKYERLVSTNDTIDGLKPKLPNSVAVADDGTLYWTDSSTSHHFDDGIFIILANGNGRLMQYDPVKKINTVLMNKIHFPNGIELSSDGSFLIFAETMMSRIIKYHLKGPKAGMNEVFIDRLPGMPDNISPDGSGGFIVSLFLTRYWVMEGVVAKLAHYPLVRRLAARLLYSSQKLFTTADSIYPLELFKKVIHWIGHFEMLPEIPPKRAAVLFVTKDGKISRSLYSSDGLTKISDCVKYKGYYYLGSPFNTFLARVKAA